MEMRISLMTPKQEAAIRRLDQVLQDARKNIKQHEQWAEDIKRNREERRDRIYRQIQK